MRESRSYSSVRGALSNERPYRVEVTSGFGAERTFGWRNKSAKGHSRSSCACASANVGHEATASKKSVSLHEANVRSHLGHLKQSLMTRRFPVTFTTSS
jgi:hypothetical protein